MRSAILAGCASLLVAGPAAAQSPPPTPPAAIPITTAAGPLPTLAPDAGMSACVGSAVAGDSCGAPGPRAWGSAEYLLWWITPMNTPPLIQTVPAAAAAPGGTLPAGAAATFFPSTRQLEFGSFDGLRATTGVNFARFGVELSGFWLDRNTRRADLFSTGVPFAVAQGYVSAGAGQPAVLFASLPGEYVGGVTASVDSRLWGLEGHVRRPWYAFLVGDSVDVLTGFRYLNLEENIFVSSRSIFPDGGAVDIQDSVRTRNEFYGPQVGMNGRFGGLSRGLGMDWTGKAAVGGVRQRAELSGFNSFIPPGGPPDTELGGLYVRPSNQGVFTRDKFAAVFELNTRLTYNFNSWAQASVGYSITWISSVMRPGEAIDPVINDARARFVADPTPSEANRPVFTWRANDLWAQGLTFGMRLQY